MPAVEPGRCGEHWMTARGWRQGTALTLPVRAAATAAARGADLVLSGMTSTALRGEV